MSLRTTLFNIALAPFLLVNKMLNGFRALFDKDTNNMVIDLAEEVKKQENLLCEYDYQIDVLTDKHIENVRYINSLESVVKALTNERDAAQAEGRRMCQALMAERDAAQERCEYLETMEHQRNEAQKQLAEATFQLHKVTKERSNLLNQVAELVERNNKEYDELFGAREDLAAERAKNIKLKEKLKKRSAK